MAAQEHSGNNPDQGQVENIFDVRWLDGDSQAGRSRVCLKSGNELFIPFVDKPADSFLQVRIRGDNILLATKRPEGISTGNVLKGVVKRIEIVDGQAILKVDAGEPFTVRLTARAVLALRLREGQEAFLIVKTRSRIVL